MISAPLPTRLYHTPGAVLEVPQVPTLSKVASTVVPSMISPQSIGIALAQRSLAGATIPLPWRLTVSVGVPTALLETVKLEVCGPALVGEKNAPTVVVPPGESTIGNAP